MKTSYFAKYKEDDGVNIAIKSVPGFKGKSFQPLYPKWWFLKKYKKDGDKKAYTKAYYEEVLNNLDPDLVWEQLHDKTLLCWEKSGSFCHRRIVAEWLENQLGVKIPEVGYESK